MTPENKNVESRSLPERRPSRTRRALAALTLTAVALAPGILHEQAKHNVGVNAEQNPDADPVRQQTREAFENVMYDDLYRCHVHDIALGEPIDMDEYGNKIPRTPTLEYSMSVTPGAKADDFPPRLTGDGATVEVGWQRYGSAFDVRFDFKGKQPKEFPDPHSYRSHKATTEAEESGEFHQEVELDPSVDGERTIDLLHSGEVALYDSRAQANGEKPPSKILQKYCGNVTVMMRDGKAEITDINVEGTS